MDFDSMQWHRVLSEYGVSAEHEDPDVEMLNKVVEKSIIKKIKSMLDTLDAASSKQMRHAAQIMEQISYYVDTDEKAYQVSESTTESSHKCINSRKTGLGYGYCGRARKADFSVR